MNIDHMVYHWVDSAGDQYGCGTYPPRNGFSVILTKTIYGSIRSLQVVINSFTLSIGNVWNGLARRRVPSKKKQFHTVLETKGSLSRYVAQTDSLRYSH